jgi:hypothetical protein
VRARDEKKKINWAGQGAQLVRPKWYAWGSSFSSRRDSPAAAGKRAALGSGVEEAEHIGDEAEKVEELLLLRLVPAEARGAAGNAGKQRRPWW